MLVLIFIAVLILLLIVGVVRKRFQEATLYWGRIMAGLDQAAQGRGMQDELTPPYQTNLMIAYWVACLGLFVWGFFVLPWYIALPWPVAFAAAKRLLKDRLPAPSSEHYRQKIIASLTSRRDRFLRVGDNLKGEITSRYITHLQRDDLT